jgi:type II secretion system protein D
VPAAVPAAAGAEKPANGAPNEPAGGTRSILPRSVEFKGERVKIAAGDIEVLEFLRFLADYTGLPVIVDSRNQQVLKTSITIAAPLESVTGDIVTALLKANGFLITRQLLPSGEEVLNVESSQGPVPVGQEEPSPTQVIKVNEQNAEVVKGGVVRVEGVRPDEIATMVFTLKYTQPTDAITSLNNLIGGPKVAVKTKAFSIVDVKNSMMVIVTAKFGLLNYLAKLLSIIDVPVKEPERIVQIIDVEHADVDDMVQLILSFLQGRTGFGGASRFGQRAPGAPIAQPGVATPQAAAGGGARGQQEFQTNLIPDWRTQKIIVETYSERDLEDINMLIRELDTRYDIRRLKTHIYQVRYLKADEVASDLQLLVGGSSFGLSGQRGLGTRGLAGPNVGAGGGRGAATGRQRGIGRIGGRQPGGNVGAPTTGVPGAAGGGQNAPQPALIVPHVQTNSLIIQAEPEDYAEILNILGQIDVKRRQVFLEAALVSVTAQSRLNYTIELLAGEPNDTATRALFASSFGLTGIDIENFNRLIPNIADPAAVPKGALLAIMNRGKFPAIITFFKTNTDSQVLATPFILADDNQNNVIDIIETRFVQNTNTVNNATTTSQEGEDAGITLDITPTISSQKAVFLELTLEVSEFAESGGSATVLPPKTKNSMTSAVTIPDGEIFVIGGLTRERKEKSVAKVPLLGDIPLLGKLFRQEASSKSASNLYIFLRAHILTHPDFLDGIDLTARAQDFVHAFAPELEPVRFPRPNVSMPPRAEQDSEAPARFYNRSFTEGFEAPRGPYSAGSEHGPASYRKDSYQGDAESPEPAKTREARGTRETPAPKAAREKPKAERARPERGSEAPAPPPGGLKKPAGEDEDEIPPSPTESESATKESKAMEPGPGESSPAESKSSGPDQNIRALKGSGLELDPQGKSWLVPLRRQTSPPSPAKEDSSGGRGQSDLSPLDVDHRESWLGVQKK